MFLGLALPFGVFRNPSSQQISFLASQCGLTGLLVRHFGPTAWEWEAAVTYLLLGVIGVGLWRLLPWARTGVIVLSILEILSGIELTIEFLYAHLCLSVDMIGAIGGAILLWYFSRTKIKQIFLPRDETKSVIPI
jgi:hypothetical protein